MSRLAPAECPRALRPSRIAAQLPGRPLLSVGLLQLLLGCAMVALSLSMSPPVRNSPVRNSCPFWAGSSVILSGIIGLTTWKRPQLLLVNLFVLLSVVCVILNLAGVVLCCQGAQFVSSMSNCYMSEDNAICMCCEDTQSAKCTDDKLLKLFRTHSCSTVHILLKKVLFGLCALNALSTAVCMVAATLLYLQIFRTRRPCLEEPRLAVEEVEERNQIPDPDEFVPPAPPPSYFSTFYSYTPQLARRLLGTGVIPLPHIYGARIKGVEVFCPLDPPPPYEEVQRSTGDEEIIGPQGRSHEPADSDVSANGYDCTGPPIIVVHPQSSMTVLRQFHRQMLKRSISDPALLDMSTTVKSCEAATQTETRPDLSMVTLRHGKKGRIRRAARPRSMVDYETYRDTKEIVARFLEQTPNTMPPEVKELVESIKIVLKSDEEHMEEAVLSANFIDQAISSQQHSWTVNTLPCMRRPRLIHLQSCGDLSTFTQAKADHRQGEGQRAEPERPHSLIGLVQETAL
ncbi:protein FAM189A2 [Polypterus senegalus]|uniref:protein FAM189A2 n=1 Tax=Polypterus senegalus TaxID=55291 RepID=UPI001965A573|nr:protein FAM189A2 [Polypterus senegalus]XP_039606688.1 protein FAM189A2 [Polypterus senegalus]XP_039606689.1 protein FAM189A2 [Polypterus senegalus]